MLSSATEPRPFVPGTTGWTASDLDNPHVEMEWVAGRYEIIEGVLTRMPAAYYPGTTALDELIFILKVYLKSKGLPSRFAHELDIMIDESRVVVADAAWLSAEDERKQSQRAKSTGRSDPTRTRFLTPPTLRIETVSPGHELHDRRTKWKWYAEFGVPNYWILDGFRRSLQCLVNEGGTYRVDVEGKEKEEFRPALFPGLVVSLGTIWHDQ